MAKFTGIRELSEQTKSDILEAVAKGGKISVIARAYNMRPNAVRGLVKRSGSVPTAKVGRSRSKKQDDSSNSLPKLAGRTVSKISVSSGVLVLSFDDGGPDFSVTPADGRLLIAMSTVV